MMEFKWEMPDHPYEIGDKFVIYPKSERIGVEVIDIDGDIVTIRSIMLLL